MAANGRNAVLWACVLAVLGAARHGAFEGPPAARAATFPATRPTSRPTTQPAEIVLRTQVPKTTLRVISPGKGTKTALRLRWPTGRYRVRYKSVGPHTVTTDGQTTEIQKEIEVTQDFVLGPADKNGVRRLRGTCTRVRIRTENDALDSAVPGWERRHEGRWDFDLAMLRAQMGMTISAVLDKAQRVTRIACRPGPRSVDNPEHFREMSAFMAQSAAHGVISWAFGLNRLLPVQPVAPGATWEARYTERVPGRLGLSCELTWKLTGIEKTQLGRVATLTYEARIKPQPQRRGDKLPEVDTQATGTLRLALDAGWLTEGFHRFKFRLPQPDRDISVESVVQVEPIPRKKR